MPKKDLNIVKGEPELYDEKKKPLNLAMTPTGAKLLDEMAKERGLTRSELVERIARGIIPLQPEIIGTDNQEESKGQS
ncbi:MAG TPA: hypothetical protein DCE56_23040 [Cyanobacteria bacterium UBA8553]|nr:hypothetical protein [Cyanobacteria bacterium UBA8553]HAJ62221.1 hypothetical protein [Cyanobacteria bacterium UBA8543]